MDRMIRSLMKNIGNNWKGIGRNEREKKEKD